MSDLPKVITLDELARYLRISRANLYKLVRAGKVPGAFKIGTTWRFNRSTIEVWMEGGHVEVMDVKRAMLQTWPLAIASTPPVLGGQMKLGAVTLRKLGSVLDVGAARLRDDINRTSVPLPKFKELKIL